MTGRRRYAATLFVRLSDALAAEALRVRVHREARLQEIENLIAAGEAALAFGFERAGLLDALGRTQDAHQAYLDVIASDSTHAGALNAFGRLLDRTGYHSAARTAFERAVETHPSDPTSHGNLGTSLLDAGETERARRHFEIALRLDPGNVVAHQCLAIMLLRLGDEEAAAAHGRFGFRHGASTWPYRGSAPPVYTLVLHSALGGNVPIDRFIDDRTFAKSTIVAEFFDPAVSLPPHALVINAIGDASRCRVALHAAQRLSARTSVPVINAPARVAATTREANSRALRRIAGVRTPRTVVFKRSVLASAAAEMALREAGFDWPVIVRAPGFQTGKNCFLVARSDELARAVADLPGDELLVIEFLDVRAPDGNVRKYRVMMVDGAVFPLHLAISRRWMVHYFSSDMADRPEHQREEAAFLDDMEATLSSHVVGALRALAGELGLDYGGIDFGIDERGFVVVFEANATMIVPPASAESSPHRRAATARIEAAVRAMLLTRAGSKHWSVVSDSADRRNAVE